MISKSLAGNNALPMHTVVGPAGDPGARVGWASSRGGGTSSVTSWRVSALKASCTPAGKPSVSSISAAVTPSAPARTMPSAIAMLVGDTTQFSAADVGARRWPNRAMPSTTASTGAPDGGVSRATPSARNSIGPAGGGVGSVRAPGHQGHCTRERRYRDPS